MSLIFHKNIVILYDFINYKRICEYTIFSIQISSFIIFWILKKCSFDQSNIDWDVHTNLSF